MIGSYGSWIRAQLRHSCADLNCYSILVIIRKKHKNVRNEKSENNQHLHAVFHCHMQLSRGMLWCLCSEQVIQFQPTGSQRPKPTQQSAITGHMNANLCRKTTSHEIANGTQKSQNVSNLADFLIQVPFSVPFSIAQSAIESAGPRESPSKGQIPNARSHQWQFDP